MSLKNARVPRPHRRHLPCIGTWSAVASGLNAGRHPPDSVGVTPQQPPASEPRPPSSMHTALSRLAAATSTTITEPWSAGWRHLALGESGVDIEPPRCSTAGEPSKLARRLSGSPPMSFNALFFSRPGSSGALTAVACGFLAPRYHDPAGSIIP